jgi:hypothetical protein
MGVDMAIHVPNVPRRPPVGSGRGSFWRGFFAAIGIVFILYLSLCTFVTMKFSGGSGLREMSDVCDTGDYWVEVDGTKYTIQPGEAREFRSESQSFGYGCGHSDKLHHKTCGHRFASLWVARFPDSDTIFIRCDGEKLGSQFDSGHGSTIYEHSRPIPGK